MKNIIVAYNCKLGKGEKILASRLESVLKKSGYGTELTAINSDQDTDALVKRADPARSQLLFSVNMAGYNLISTGSAPALNRLKINIVNYINLPAEIFDPILGLRMNYTMSFLFSSEKDTEHVKKIHTFLRNVYHAPNIEQFVPAYLKELDWRY